MRASEWSTTHPRSTLLVWLVVVAVALGGARAHLELATSNLDLVDPDLPEVARFLAAAEELGTPNQIVVVLEGDDGAALRRGADDLALQVRGVPGVAGAWSRRPSSSRSLHSRAVGPLETDPYFLSRDGGMAFVFVDPADPRSSLETIEPVVNGVRAAVTAFDAGSRKLRAGLTGVPIYAMDDRDAVRRDTLRLSWLSLGLVALVFVAGFRSRRRPLLATLTLVASAAVGLGLATIVPGRLTLVSAAFLSILFGLGIDAGIHLVDRTEAERDTAESEADAVRRAVGALAPGLLTSTLTTASVLWVLVAGGLRGFAELGLIAGNGLVVSLLANVTLLPALLVLMPESVTASSVRWRLGSMLWRLQRPKVAIGAGAATLALALMPGLPFDTDYLDLEPRGSEAARLEREMATRSDFSPQSLVLRAPDHESVGHLVAALRALPSVGSVLSVLDTDAVELLGGSVPGSLRQRVAPDNGQLAVWAWPREQVWDPVARDRFVADVRTLDPHTTGMPVIGRFLVDRSKRALRIGSVLGGLALLLWLWLDLRRPTLVAIAALPPLLTAAVLPGAMRLCGISWNPIDVIALPVILGIAVDDGIHMIHRFLAEAGALEPTLRGTGRSITLTSLTTIAAFGALGLADHRGLASFGQVAALGVILALLISVLILPQLLVRFGTGAPRIAHEGGHGTCREHGASAAAGGE